MRKIYNVKQIAASLLLKSRKMVKGSISLFLALVVTPLLGMTLMMVESIRYQDVIEEMIEINDLSAFATLGNYDPFIKERFGLLAVSQDEEIKEKFNKYFVENERLVGNDVIIKSCTIDGEYSLEDLEMMKLQVLEYAEYSAFFDAVFEGGNITELLDKLNEAINVDDLQTMTTVMENSADVCDAIGKAAQAIIDLNDFITNKYYPALEDYKDAYDDFEDDLNDYIDELNDYSGAADKIYEDKDVKDAWDDFYDGYYESRKTYKRACDNLASKIEDLKDKLDDVSENLEAALDAYGDLSDELTNNDQQAFSVQTDFTVNIATALLPLMQAIADEDYDNFVSETVDDLRDLSKALNDMKMTDFDADSDTDDTKGDWYVEIGSIDSIADAVSRFITDFEDVDYEVDFSTLQDLIDAVVSFVDMPSMIDANCRAVIDYEKNTEPLLYDSVGETVTRAVHRNNDIANAVGIVAIAQLTACIEELKMPPNIIQAILLSVEILIATTALSLALLLWVQNVTINNVLRIVDIGQIWDHVLLAGYAAYNFPNRTNYMQSVDISGYNYGMEIYRDVCGQDMDNPGLTENWEAYASISGVRMLYSAITTGSALPQPNSKTFYGAEQEYLLCGWTNEVYNQCGAFYNILMLRLVLDLVPLFKDQEVTEMAEAAEYFAPLVYILVLLGDAFLDTFILSNGGDLPLIKFECYCTPTGVLSLASDLASLSDMTELVGEVLPICQMIDDMTTNSDFSSLNPFADGVLPYSSYTDHMFLLFLTCTHTYELWDRIQNVVINESRAYYDYHGKSFDISKSYTYVHSEIVYDINPMFDFSSLTDSASVFTKTVHQERHIGY